MSNNLFENVICFGDIHYGLKNNSKEHNQDCEDFVDWLIEQAKVKNCKTCMFLGDWHHHRSTINVLTLNYTVASLRKLNGYFDKVYVMVGNHDMFYRERRDVHSLIASDEFANIILVDKPVTINNVTLIPWLVEDEWKQISKIKSKYIFGHLELPGFRMNAAVVMPDHGTLNSTHFENQDYVFSGHFHNRQKSGKVHYIGNPFGHNFGDAWDFDRGAMYLEWGGTPEYINYTSGPRYINTTLSALLADPDSMLQPNTYVQVVLDMDITFEEASVIKETFIDQYNVREFKILQNQDEHSSPDFVGDISLQTVDQIVVDQLTNIESNSYDSTTLIEIYNGL